MMGPRSIMFDASTLGMCRDFFLYEHDKASISIRRVTALPDPPYVNWGGWAPGALRTIWGHTEQYDDADREWQYGERDAAMAAAHASGGYSYARFTTVAKVARERRGGCGWIV